MTDGLLKAWGEQKQKVVRAEPSVKAKKHTAQEQKKHQKNRRGRSSQQQRNLKALDGFFHNEKPATYDAFIKKINQAPIYKIKKEPESCENAKTTPLISSQQAIEAAASLLSSGLNTHANYWALSRNLNLHPHTNPHANSFTDRFYAFLKATTQYQGAKAPQQKGKQTSIEIPLRGEKPIPVKTEQASQTANTKVTNSATITRATSLFSMGVIAQAKSWPMRILGLMGLVASQAENSQAAPVISDSIEDTKAPSNLALNSTRQTDDPIRASAHALYPASEMPSTFLSDLPIDTSANTQAIPDEVRAHLSKLNLSTEGLAALGKFEINKLPPEKRNTVITIAIANFLYQLQFGQLPQVELENRPKRELDKSLTEMTQDFITNEGWKKPEELKEFLKQVNSRRRRGAEEDLTITEQVDITFRLMLESASIPETELAEYLNIHGTVSPDTAALLHRHFPETRKTDTEKIAKVAEKCTLGRFLTDTSPILALEGAIENLGKSIEELIKSRQWTEDQKIKFRIRTLDGFKDRYKTLTRSERFWQDLREGYAYGVPAVILFEKLRQDMLAKREMTKMSVEEIERLKVAKNGWQSIFGLMPGVAAVNSLLDLGEAVHEGSKDICRYLEDIFIAGLGIADLAGSIYGAHQFQEHISVPLSEVSQEILNQKLTHIEAELNAEMAQEVHTKIANAEQEFKQAAPVVTVGDKKYIYLAKGENKGLYQVQLGSDGIELVSLTQPHKTLTQYLFNEDGNAVVHKLSKEIPTTDQTQIWQDLTTQSQDYAVLKSRSEHHQTHIAHLINEQSRLRSKHVELEQGLAENPGVQVQKNLQSRMEHIEVHLTQLVEKLSIAEEHNRQLEARLTKSYMHLLLLKTEAADLMSVSTLISAKVATAYEEVVMALIKNSEETEQAIAALEKALAEEAFDKNQQVDLKLEEITKESQLKAAQHIEEQLNYAQPADKKYSSVKASHNGVDLYVTRVGKGGKTHKYKLIKDAEANTYHLRAKSSGAPSENGHFILLESGYLEQVSQAVAALIQYQERSTESTIIALTKISVTTIDSFFEEAIPAKKEYSKVLQSKTGGMYVIRQFRGKAYRYLLLKEPHTDLYKLIFDREVGDLSEAEHSGRPPKNHGLYRISNKELKQVGLKGGGKSTQHLSQARKELLRAEPIFTMTLNALRQRFELETYKSQLQQLEKELILQSRNIAQLNPAERGSLPLNQAQQAALDELQAQQTATLARIQQTDEIMRTLQPEGEEAKTSAEVALEEKIAEIERELAHEKRQAHDIYKNLRHQRNALRSELHTKAAEQAAITQEIEALRAEKPTEKAQRVAKQKNLQQLGRKKNQVESKLAELTERTQAANAAYDAAISNYDPRGLKQQMLEAKILAESDFRAENKASHPPDSIPIKKRKNPENANPQDTPKKQTPLDRSHTEDDEQAGPSGVRHPPRQPEAVHNKPPAADVQPQVQQAGQALQGQKVPPPKRQGPLQFGARSLSAAEQQMLATPYANKYKTWLEASSKPIDTARLHLLSQLRDKINNQLATLEISISNISKLPDAEGLLRQQEFTKLQETKNILLAQKIEAIKQIQAIQALLNAKAAAEHALEQEKNNLEQEVKKELIKEFIALQGKEAELKAEIKALNQAYAEVYQETKNNPENPNLIARQAGLAASIKEKTQEAALVKDQIEHFNLGASAEKLAELTAKIEALVKSIN